MGSDESYWLRIATGLCGCAQLLLPHPCLLGSCRRALQRRGIDGVVKGVLPVFGVSVAPVRAQLWELTHSCVADAVKAHEQFMSHLHVLELLHLDSTHPFQRLEPTTHWTWPRPFVVARRRINADRPNPHPPPIQQRSLVPSF